ncbi:MAG: hypothetical protein H8E03_00920 [Pelagibacteraceae bacterium]|nr:hypothetical protein [Pelagibacteraceae bacterium]
MNKKIGILFTSRNNYNLFHSWLDNVDTEGFDILNIDEDSTDLNKTTGKSICDKFNVVYKDREERGMQNNLVTACNYFAERDVKFILWFQHDCFPLTSNFFTKFNDFVQGNELTDFGAIGFNCFHSGRAHNDFELNGHFIDNTARTPLELGDKWYRNVKYYPNTRVRYDALGFDKPFAVESTAWYVTGVNIESYLSNIVPTGDYHFFHAWDDICFQFLNKNIYNICIPDFDFKHDQRLKESLGLPANSPRAGNKREHFYGKWGHLGVWETRWGFDYENRDTFLQVRDKYENTLLSKFYEHDPMYGSLESFDL